MKDVSVNDGRTVLFVSHNMAAVSTLCTVGLLMQNGTTIDFGPTKNIISEYILLGKSGEGELSEKDIIVTKQNENLKFKRIAIIGKNGPTSSFGLNEDIVCEIDYEVVNNATIVVPTIHLLDRYGDCILSSFNADSANISKDGMFGTIQDKGIYRTRCIIPKLLLNDNNYSINAFLSPNISFRNMTEALEVISFEVTETGDMRKEYTDTWIGQIRPKLAWNTLKIS